MRFPQYTSEWRKNRLESLVKMSKGYGITKDQLSVEGQPCILYGELYTTYKNEVISEVKSKTDIDTKGLVYSQANDVIIPSSGETPEDIATACCVMLDDILLGGDLNILRPYKDNGCFLSYQLNGRRKYDIARVAQGASIVHLHNEHLRSLNIFTPESLDEQEKIVSLLALIDERIDTQSKIIEKLQSLMKSICHTIFNKDKTKKLGDCVVCHASTLIESDIENSPSGIYPVFGATGVIRHIDTFDIEENAILVLKDGANAGKIQFAKTPHSVIGTSNYLTLKDNTILKYVYFALLDFNFDKYKVGSGIPHIYFKDYKEEKIYYPSYEKQTRIVKLLSSIENKIDLESIYWDKLKEQKKYLLSNMFI